MNTDSTIDIIMATYNGRQYIKDAINSVIQQTYPYWILTIVNDGGEDISDIVNSYNDIRMKLISAKHGGVSHATNIGIKNSRSKYIAYLDDDDIWYPNHLDSLYNIISKEKVDLVYSNTYVVKRYVDTKEEIDRILLLPENKDITQDEFITKNYIADHAKIHTRAILKKTGLYDDTHENLYENDWDFLRRLMQLTVPIRINKVTNEWNIWIDRKNNNIVNRMGGEINRNPEKVLADRTYILNKTPKIIKGPKKIERLSKLLTNEVLTVYALRDTINALSEKRHRESSEKDSLFKIAEDRINYLEKEVQYLKKFKNEHEKLLDTYMALEEEYDNINKTLEDSNNKLNEIYESLTWKIFLKYAKIKHFIVKNKVFKKDVLIIAGCPGTVKEYRVENLKKELEYIDYSVDIVDIEKVNLSKILNHYNCFIFQRVQFNREITAFLDECTKLNKLVLYDIDDLVFEESMIESIPSLKNRDSLEKNKAKSLYSNNKKLMLKADAVLVSSEDLYQRISKLGLKTFIHKNVQNFNFIDTAKKYKRNFRSENKNKIIIGYSSGTKTHNHDFKNIEGELEKILTEYKNVYLKILGYLNISNNLRKKFGSRIIQVQYSESLEEYVRNLSSFDINIVPLENNEFNNAKSNIKFQELSFLGIPTIASNVGEYRELRNNKDIILCNQGEDWYVGLKLLVENKQERIRIGESALEHAYKNYTLLIGSVNLEKILNTLPSIKESH
ncbi:MAG: glycosyltransferase [Patescibacteria group bacterium]